MRDPMTDRPIGEAEVREKFGVGPDKVVEVQALCGDSTDNVPGVPGIGVKTAAELINAYGDLETLLARADEIKQPKRRQSLIENEAKARLSKELVKLDDDVPLPCPLSALRVKPYDPEKLFPFLDEMELRALKSRIERRLSIAPPTATAGPSEPVIPEIPPFPAEPHLCRRRYGGRAGSLDRVGGAGGRGRDLGGAERARRQSAGILRHRAGGRAGEGGLCPARAPRAAGGRGGGAAGPPPSPPPHAGEGTGGGEAACLSFEEALARLKPLLEDPGVLKIGHDMKGMAHLLLRHGIAVAPCDCTMLMSYVLDGGQVEHTIEALTKRALSHDLTPAKEILGTGRNAICFAEVATARGRDFACERADAALRLHALLKARLLREHMTAFYETIERPLVPAVAAMENAGVRVDRDALAELSRDFAPAHRRDRAVDLARCRARIQHRLDQAARRRAVRETAASRRQKGEDRRLRHRRLDPGDAWRRCIRCRPRCSNGGS